MKKVFSLAFALAVMAANAQDQIMIIEKTDGTSVDVKNPLEVTFEEREDANAGWTSLGMCQYTEDFMTGLYEVSTVTYEVEVQEKDDEPGMYRLVNPYGAAYPYNEPGWYDEEEDHYLLINAVDPVGVYIEKSDTGMDWGYGNVQLWSKAGLYMEQYGYDFFTVKREGFCGTLEDGVIGGFASGMLVGAEPNYEGGTWYIVGNNGAFKVVLPSAASAPAAMVKPAVAMDGARNTKEGKVVAMPEKE